MMIGKMSEDWADEAEAVVVKETEVVAAGTREEWSLATNSATRVCFPGLTFSKVYEGETIFTAEILVGLAWSSQR